MFARHVVINVKKEKIDEALQIYQTSVMPAGKSYKGYRGIYVLTDRKASKIITISLWDSAEDTETIESRGYFQAQTDKFKGVLLTPPVQEGLEVSFISSKTR